MFSKYRKFYDTEYIPNCCVLKKYNENNYKLTLFKALKNKNLELNKTVTKNTVNSQKLQNNLIRACSNVTEIVLCNEWQYFFTGTIDPNKYDREKFDVFYKDLSKFINNYNYRNNYNIKYLLIPELHKDGKSWHIHGLLSGFPLDKLLLNEHGYLNWLDYEKRFGYCSFAQVYDPERS